MSVEQLVAIEDIKRLFAARLRCLDAKEWDRYGDFHTEDVVSASWVDLPGGSAPSATAPQVVGREALTSAIKAALGGPVHVTTVHHGHNPEIDVLSPVSARGVWAMEDRLWWTNGDHEEWLHGFGHYHEEYRRVDGRWLISARTLTRTRVTQSPSYFSYLDLASGHR